MDPIKVLVVDDHALFRRGIAAVLANQEGLVVGGEAVDGLEAIEKAREIAPDVILMDLNMPRCSGLEAIQALQAEMPQVNILVLTVSEMETDLFASVKFGATGYLLKKVEPEDPLLPEGGVNTILMVDTIHYVKDRATYGKKLLEGLAPGGRLIIIDFVPKPMSESP